MLQEIYKMDKFNIRLKNGFECKASSVCVDEIEDENENIIGYSLVFIDMATGRYYDVTEDEIESCSKIEEEGVVQ